MAPAAAPRIRSAEFGFAHLPMARSSANTPTLRRSRKRTSGKSSSIPLTPPYDDIDLLARLRDVIRREHAAPLHAGINDRAPSDQRAGREHAVATDLGLIADDGAEFFEAGGN